MFFLEVSQCVQSELFDRDVLSLLSRGPETVVFVKIGEEGVELSRVERAVAAGAGQQAVPQEGREGVGRRGELRGGNLRTPVNNFE